MRKIQRGGETSDLYIKNNKELIDYLYSPDQLGDNPNKFLKIVNNKTKQDEYSQTLDFIMQFVDFDTNSFKDKFDYRFRQCYEVPKKQSWFSFKTNEESNIRPYSWFFSEESDIAGYVVDNERFKREIERYREWKKKKDEEGIETNGGKKRRNRKKYKKRQTRKKTNMHYRHKKKYTSSQ